MVNRRKKTLYMSDSMLEFVSSQAVRLGTSENWVVNYSLCRARAAIEAIPSADELLEVLQANHAYVPMNAGESK